MAVSDDVREAMRETNERFCPEVVGEAAPFQRILCIHVARNDVGPWLLITVKAFHSLFSILLKFYAESSSHAANET